MNANDLSVSVINTWSKLIRLIMIESRIMICRFQSLRGSANVSLPSQR